MARVFRLRCLVALLCVANWAFAIDVDERRHDFDVVIAGGSTAAFAAAVSAAESGSRVALLEPTDWIGGQITSSGVPAIDEAWHKLRDGDRVTMDVATIARMPENISPHLRRMLTATGCPGKCWVSRFCFQPRDFLDQHLRPLESKCGNQLVVFRETVVKQARTKESRIESIVAIQRFFKDPKRTDVDGYDRLPSQDLADWYSVRESGRFRKRVIEFGGDNTVFIDATEWGELLALSGAPYLIGVEDSDGSLKGDDTLGQAITYGFVMELHAEDRESDGWVPNPKGERQGFGGYKDKPDAWNQVWTYRRLRAKEQAPTTGDLSLQNWGYYVEHNEGGNDYPFGYLFLDRTATGKQVGDGWQGGVDLEVMSAAEQHAYGWHHWMKSRAPEEIDSKRLSLNRSVLGAEHGLSKLPYIRDTRRSIGIDQFVLRAADLSPTKPGALARQFSDRVAIGAYPIDIHPLADREYPKYVDQEYEIAPFTIPFRAMTNGRFQNLLVAGKTMAQSFLANSATRLHPIEWSTGTAAGVAANRMSREKLTSQQLLGEIERLQMAVRERTPIEWKLH